MHFRARKKHLTDISMNEPAMTDKDGNTLTLMDTLEDGTDLVEQAELSIQTRLLYRFLHECLNERELEIISLRYGLYGHREMTQKEVADRMGISQSYISRLEKKIIATLRARIARKV